MQGVRCLQTCSEGPEERVLPWKEAQNPPARGAAASATVRRVGSRAPSSSSCHRPRPGTGKPGPLPVLALELHRSVHVARQ